MICMLGKFTFTEICGKKKKRMMTCVGPVTTVCLCMSVFFLTISYGNIWRGI